ncbi:MAG: hypothetical protein HYT89_02620 [Candidatus Omnitrophica bacterium]|nr:hypothetical protein [Candidatus Omnitrophota bacterium]
MKFFRFFSVFFLMAGLIGFGPVSMAQGQDYSGQEDPNKKILKQGLLGAGVGAISAEASGGKAGTGALVGAGTTVIGGALLDTLTTPSQPRPAQAPVQYVPVQQGGYAQQAYPVQPQGYQPAPEPMYQPVYYSQPPREDPNKRILKQGLLGAGTGAIAASASGGKAGKGALIGAGTNVIGGALLDSLMGGSQQQAPPPAYYPPQPYPQQAVQPAYATSGQDRSKCRQVTYYDGEGNPVKTVEECD